MNTYNLEETTTPSSGTYDLEDQSAPSQVASAPPQVASVSPQVTPNGEMEPWKYVGGMVQGAKREPGFMKKLEMIGTGAAKGSLEFTSNLLSLAERGLRLGGQPTIVPEAYKSWAEQKKQLDKEYEGPWTTVGQIGGELLSTAPAGAAMGAVSKAAQGLSTAGKYAANILGQAGVLTGLESQRYDPNNPDQLINTQAATEALKNPLTYTLPAVGTGLASWADKARQLTEARQILPSITPRDLPNAGIGQKISRQVFAPITDNAKSLPTDISNFVQQISSRPEAMNSKDLINYAANQMNGALKVMKLKGNLLWEKPFKEAGISDPQGLKDAVISAQDILQNSSIPAAADTINLLNKGIQKNTLTVEDAKNLQTTLGKAIINARNADKGGILNDTANQLEGKRDDIMNYIGDSLSPSDYKDFMAARQYSADLFALNKSSPKIRKAIQDEAASRKLIEDLLREKGTVNKSVGIDLLPEQGQKAVAAAKIAQIMENSNTSGHFDINKFLSQTADYTQVPEIVGSDTYKSLEGLNKYLSSINEGSGKWKSTAAALGALGAASGVATGTLSGAAIPLASYAAAAYIANKAPLKTIFGALTKNLPQSTYDHLVNSATNQLTRAGYIMSDGVLKHKDEENIND